MSVVDLNPPGFDDTYAVAVAGGLQVGIGIGAATGNEGHALLWSGSAGSVIDLHQFLPSGYVSSEARGIDATGNVVGEASDELGFQHAIEWVPVPEPTTVGALCLAIPLGLRRRRGNELTR